MKGGGEVIVANRMTGEPTIKNSKKTKKRMANLLRQIVFTLIGILVLYPMIFVLMTSFKTNIDVLKNPFALSSFHPENYVEAWKIGRIGHYFFNSLIVTLITMAIALIITLLGGYAIGKLKPPGYKYITMLFLSTMFVTSEMTTIPVFMLIRDWGLLNTRWGLIIPYAAGMLAFAMFVISRFFENLPKELEESATIDGCGIFKTMIYIDIPLIKPIIATNLVMSFQGVWGEFFWALITVQDESIKTLPLGLMNFQSQFSTNYGVLSAGLVMLSLPVIMLFIFSSRHFIEGMTMGAVKG